MLLGYKELLSKSWQRWTSFTVCV